MTWSLILRPNCSISQKAGEHYLVGFLCISLIVGGREGDLIGLLQGAEAALQRSSDSIAFIFPSVSAMAGKSMSPRLPSAFILFRLA